MRAPKTEIIELAETDGDVGAFRNEVLPLIRHRHFHAQLRMRGEKFGKMWNNLPRAVNHGQREADQTAQRIEPARSVLGVFKSGQDLACAFQKQLARVRQGDASRRPQQQCDAETPFKLTYDARNRRLR